MTMLAQTSAVDAAHAEVLDLEKHLDAVFRAPRPMPLSFGKGRDLGRDDAFV